MAGGQPPSVPGARPLRFVVVSCSSEDDEHPARELHDSSAQSRGWQSAHFAPFPQEIVLRFEGLVHIAQLQLLCHQYKIPSRVELHASKEPATLAGASAASFERLGHFSLDPNARSRYRARELKTVYLQTAATMLRLQLHKCHINELNMYGQVGILAIRVHGSGAGEHIPLAPALGYGAGTADVPPPPARAGGGGSGPPPPVTAKPFQAGRSTRPVDATTQAQMRRLEEAKARAIDREDYDEAKRLKGALGELQLAGEQISALEMQKRAAVQREDYDEAKRLKEEVDVLRANANLLAGLVEDEPEQPAAQQPASPERRPPSADWATREGIGAPPPPPVPPQVAGPPSAGGSFHAELSRPTSAFDPAPPHVASAPDAATAAIASASPHGHGARDGLGTDGAANGVVGGTPGGPSTPRAVTQQEYDERALPKPADAYAVDGMPDGGSPPPLADAAGSAAFGDLPAPEPLSRADEAEAAVMIEVFGEFTVQCLYSKVWMLRQAALHRLRDVLPTLTEKHNALVALRAAMRVLRKCAHDKIAQVYLASLEMIHDVLQLGAGLKPAEVAQQVEPIVLPWLHKTADSNVRVREASEGALLGLCRRGAISIESLGAHASAPLKKSGDVYGLVGRLSLLAQLVAEFGSNVPLERALDFVKAAFDSPNASVRARAADVAREVYRVVEPDSLGWFLEGLKPKQRESLQSVFDEVDAERSLHGDEEEEALAATPVGGQRPALSEIAEGDEDDARSTGRGLSASRGAGTGSGSRSARGLLRTPGAGEGAEDESDAADAADGANPLLSSTSKLRGWARRPDAGADGASGADGAEEAGAEHTCQFCGRHDPSFDDETLDMHFWRDCPMLMPCTMCDQVVEISFLREHLLSECENAEAPSEARGIAEGTCPLCAEAVPADDEGWNDHLLVHKCKHNPRQVVAA